MLVHILSPETDNCPSWISGRERMTIENIWWSKPHERMLQTRRGQTRNLLITSWVPIRATEAGRNDPSKYFMINLHERLLPDPGGWGDETGDLITSRMRIIPLSHQRRTKPINNVLTFTTLWVNSADDKLLILFLFFPENRLRRRPFVVRSWES